MVRVRKEANHPFLFSKANREVFPPEPPVAVSTWPERRAAVQGAPQLGAAERTLDGEHRCGINKTSTGGTGGNTFPLVSVEQSGLLFLVRTTG